MQQFSTYDSLRLHAFAGHFDFSPVNAGGGTLRVDRRSSQFSVVDQPAEGGRVSVVFGIMGVIRLVATDYIIVISARSRVGRLLGKDIYKATDFSILPLDAATRSKQSQESAIDKKLVALLHAHLMGGGNFYFSHSFDVTSSLQAQATALASNSSVTEEPFWKRATDQFFWNKFLQQSLIDQSVQAAQQTDSSKTKVNDFDKFIIPVIYGFFNVQSTSLGAQSLNLTLIGRRSRYRAGTRYFSRGLDASGYVANFNETEQIVAYTPLSKLSIEPLPVEQVFSYVQTRGSVPVFWAEINTLRYRPDLQIMEAAGDTLAALNLHIDDMVKNYGDITLVNLVNSTGYERPVKEALEKALIQINHPRVHYEYFDFHRECSRMRWDRLSLLTTRLESTFAKQQYFHGDLAGNVKTKQNSVIRSNCMDCLDRTNVVQSAFARHVLTQQMRKAGVLSAAARVDDYPGFMYAFRNVWADHADAISTTYSGTGALKTDFTRTGKRSKKGLLQDGVNSITRYLKNNYQDGSRQDAFDLVQGNWIPSRTMNSNPFLELRPLFMRSVPYVFFFSLTMLLLSVLFWKSSASKSIVWTMLVAISSIYIIGHGVDYVAWPKLVPLTEVLNYEGPGWRSGAHGRGINLPFIKSAGISASMRARQFSNRIMADVELGDKKRDD